MIIKKLHINANCKKIFLKYCIEKTKPKKMLIKSSTNYRGKGDNRKLFCIKILHFHIKHGVRNCDILHLKHRKPIDIVELFQLNAYNIHIFLSK